MDAIKTKSYVMTFETGKSFIIVLPNDWDASIVSRTEDIIDHSHSPEEMFQHLDEAGIFYSVFLETNKSVPEIIKWIRSD